MHADRCTSGACFERALFLCSLLVTPAYARARARMHTGTYATLRAFVGRRRTIIAVDQASSCPLEFDGPGLLPRSVVAMLRAAPHTQHPLIRCTPYMVTHMGGGGHGRWHWHWHMHVLSLHCAASPSSCATGWGCRAAPPPSGPNLNRRSCIRTHQARVFVPRLLDAGRRAGRVLTEARMRARTRTCPWQLRR